MLVRALPKVTRRDERAFRHDRVDQQAGGEVKDRCHGVDRDAEDHPNRRCLVTVAHVTEVGENVPQYIDHEGLDGQGREAGHYVGADLECEKAYAQPKGCLTEGSEEARRRGR